MPSDAHDILGPAASGHLWNPLVSRRDLLRLASVGAAGSLLPVLVAVRASCFLFRAVPKRARNGKQDKSAKR